METENNNKNWENDEFHLSIKDWITKEKLTVSLIEVATKLWLEKSIELLVFRNEIVDERPHRVIHMISYAKRIVGLELDIKDTLDLATTISKLNVAPARIDIGRLNREWIEEKNNYPDMTSFVKDKLAQLIDVKPRSQKWQDVVLYGFGRIGRLAARRLVLEVGNGSQLRLRAIVVRNKNPEDFYKRVSLFRKDSVHGRFSGVALEDSENQMIIVNGQKIHVISANNPEDIDYEAYGLKDVLVIDNTGAWRDREGLSKHLKAKGVKQVLLTAPGKDDIPNIVYGVNQNSEQWDLTKEPIVSAASCTTNAIVPTLSALEKEYGIISGHVETIHSYTNDQNLLDNFHKKERRGRSAALNMVITSTGAGKAAVKAIPSLKGKLTASAVRVPTPNVSLAILSLELNKKVTKDEINEFMRKITLKGTLIEQIRYMTSSELVSTDIIGDNCASAYDSKALKVSEDGKKVVLYLWYDNEFGYTHQVIRLAKHISGVKSYRYY